MQGKGTETKHSLLGASVFVLLLLVASNFLALHAVADQTITISPNIYGHQQVVVANLTTTKNAKIAYSFNASAVVEFSIQGYANYGAFPPLVIFLTGNNTSAEGIFIAPVENYTYRLAFMNPSTTTSVQVTYDFHEIEPTPSTDISLLLLVMTLAVIVVICTILFARYRGRKRV